jgi:hypothetical protein
MNDAAANVKRRTVGCQKFESIFITTQKYLPKNYASIKVQQYAVA